MSILVLDADGRPGSGINEGNLNWLGSYRECTETSFAHFCVSKVNIFNKVSVFIIFVVIVVIFLYL